MRKSREDATSPTNSPWEQWELSQRRLGTQPTISIGNWELVLYKTLATTSTSPKSDFRHQAAFSVTNFTVEGGSQKTMLKLLPMLVFGFEVHHTLNNVSL